MPKNGISSVLIVEDEFLVAMDLEQTFLDASWEVIGPVPDVQQALSALQEHRPDVVCLDMNLNGTSSTPIAEELKRIGIPFVVLTGYSAKKVTEPAYKGALVLHKPILPEELVSAVQAALA